MNLLYYFLIFIISMILINIVYICSSIIIISIIDLIFFIVGIPLSIPIFIMLIEDVIGVEIE